MKTEPANKKALFLSYLGIVLATLVAFLLGLLIVPGESRLVENSDSLAGVGLEPIAQTLEESFDPTQFESRLARLVHLHDQFATATIEQLEHLWEQSKTLDLPFRQAEIHRNIMGRFAVHDPERALALIQAIDEDSHRIDLIEVVFREWARLDLEAAKAHAHTLDLNSRKVAVASMVRSREDFSLAQLRGFAREFDLEWIAFEIANQYSALPILDHADVEWNRFFKEQADNLHDVNGSQFKTFAYLSHCWILAEGVGIIDSMSSVLSEDFPFTSMIALVARQLQVNHPDTAAELIVAQLNRDSATIIQELAVELFSHWASVDFTSAVDATMNIAAPAFRRELQTRLLEQAAQQDAEGLLVDLQSYPDSLHGLIREVAITEIAKRSPTIAASMLGDIRDLEVRARIAESVAASWGRQDYRTALAWIQTDPKVARYREVLTEKILETLVRYDPQLALNVALELPVRNDDGIGWESIIVRKLAGDDIDSAIAMLPKVRPGRTQREAYEWNILILTTWYGDVMRAFDLVVELAAIEPRGTTFSTHFMVMHGGRDVFERLDEIPAKQAKKEIASSLLLEFENTQVFSEEELSTLRKIKHSKDPVTPSPELIDATDEFIRMRVEESAD